MSDRLARDESARHLRERVDNLLTTVAKHDLMKLLARTPKRIMVEIQRAATEFDRQWGHR